jgi:multicomponent Na+:H+ antiporter subunit C
MTELLGVVAGGLFAAGTYLIIRRTLLQVILGLALLSNAVNLVIMSASGPRRAAPAIVPEGLDRLPADASDPVPQALILTAIVISFGVIAFFIVLADRVYRSTHAVDLDDLKTTDQLDYVKKPPVGPPPRAAKAGDVPEDRAGEERH